MDKLFPECNHMLIEAGYAYTGLMCAWGDVKIHGYKKEIFMYLSVYLAKI